MHRPGRSGGDLVIVERDEDVLRVAAVDAVAVAVEHEDVDEVGVAVDLLALRCIEATAAADHPVARTDRHIQPDLVGVGRSLREQMAKFERADHRLDEIFLARLEDRQFRPERGVEFPVDFPPLLDAEDVDAGDVLEVLGVDFDHIGAILQPRLPRVGGREEVVMDGQPAGIVVELRSKIGGTFERHVAGGTTLLGHCRVVETPCAMAGDPGEEKGVVVVLAAEKFLVGGQFLGEVDLVAGGAELRVAVEVLEKGLLMHRRLGLHQLVVDPLEERIVALRKGIVNWFVDRVVGVAPRAVDVGDGMAGGASDAGLRGGVVDVVVILVVEGAAVEGHRIVAASAPPRRGDAAVSFKRDLPRFADARQVDGIVEAREMMAASLPAGMDVCVALLAVAIHHHDVGGDVVARSGAGQRRLKVLRPLLGPLGMPVTRVLGVEIDHQTDGTSHDAGVCQPHPPLDLRSYQAVQPVEPACSHGACHMGPVRRLCDQRRPRTGIGDPQPQQQPTGDEHHQRDGQQGVADADRAAVFPVPRVEHVEHAEDDKRRHKHEAEHEVNEEHPLVEPVLIRLPRGPLQERDAGQVGGVGNDHR